MFQIKQTLAAAALAVMATAALPALAADPAPATAPAAPAPAAHRHHNHAEAVEARIAALRASLKITDAQAAQWDAVAQAMRDTAKSEGELVKAKRQNAASMTAVDDLHAYQEITQAHADGIKKVAAAFEPLYAAMSPDQKMVADQVFRSHKHNHGATHPAH